MVKRVFDLFFAIVGLVLLAPLFVIITVAINLDSPGPVFYRGERIGEKGRVFKIYKFRTMVIEADRMGPALTRGGDPRVTTVGRILRRWKVDELPQLINVIRGEMGVVGPRPEAPEYVRHYTAEQRKVLEVRPGITGLTQVRFRHEESLLSRCANPEQDYVERIMPQKLAMDLEYLENQSLLLDLKLLVRTFLCLFEGTAQAQLSSAGEAHPVSKERGSGVAGKPGSRSL